MNRAAAVALSAVAMFVVSTALVGCTGGSDTSASYPAGNTVGTALPTHASPSHRPRRTGAEGPQFPSVRWDLVPRGPLPVGCATHGKTVLNFSAPDQVAAFGPSLTCLAGHRYWVRAVVKVGIYGADGRWTYLTLVQPSAPTLGGAAAQRSEMIACSVGERLLAVASFVFLEPDGHQVRYKVVGGQGACR